MDCEAIIRRSRPRDYQAIAEIYNESILKGGITFDEEEFTMAHIQKWVSGMGPGEGLWVLEKNLNVLGWGILKRYSDRPAYRHTVESSIYLSHQHHGQGYGKQLQQELLMEAHQMGHHHLVAKIVACNHASIAFHQRFGYELVGTQKEVGFSRGQWYDIAILQYIFPNS